MKISPALAAGEDVSGIGVSILKIEKEVKRKTRRHSRDRGESKGLRELW